MDDFIDLMFDDSLRPINDFVFQLISESEDCYEDAESKESGSELRVRINESAFPCTEFTGHKTLLHFHINAFEQVDFFGPPVVNLYFVDQNKGQNLRRDWVSNVLIKDYISYSETKGRIFRRLVREKKVFGWIWKQSQPVFIGSAGVFALSE